MSQSPERPDDLAWLLANVSYSLTTELTAALQELNVSPRANCVLATAMQGEYTQTALAAGARARQDDDGRHVDALERAGLVERRTSSADRRARVIAVTGAGAAKVAEGERIVEQIQEDVLSGALARQSRRVHGRAAPARRRAPLRADAVREAGAPPRAAQRRRRISSVQDHPERNYLVRSWS